MKKNLIAILSLVAIMAIAIVLLFKPVLQSPNGYLFTQSGDAVKSYYNFSYYLKYDSGMIFDGNNYPYGDHLQYINSHHFHQGVVNILKKVFPVSNYGVAFLNLSMIFSLLIGVIFIFLILRHYKLPIWYSIIISLIILFLSPQLGRIQGHFEMVYLFFIPMFWYLLIVFRKGKKPWLWGILLVLSGLIGGFTSAYYAAFYSIFLLSVLLSDIIKNRGNLKQYIKPGISLLIMAIIPLIVVKGLVSITDTAGIRPTNPWGFFIFNSNIKSIFLPNALEFRNIIQSWFNLSYEWEGRAYVGLPPTLLALSMVYAFFHQLITKKKNISLYIDQDMNTYLLGAFFVLLFSMCIPFKIFNLKLDFLLNIIPQLRQFRCLGRFSWIFYYVFTIYTAIFFYNLYLKLKAKGFAKFPVLFLSFVILFWGIDAAANAKSSLRNFIVTNNILESNHEPYLQILSDANIQPNNYQAIFFLPFANTSGDKLFFSRGLEQAFPAAMSWSYHTGLPMVQSFEPRLPFSDALTCIQMLADSTIRKTRINDMNEKPLLLIYTNEELIGNEIWLKNNSKKLWSNDEITLASVNLNIFQSSHENWRKYATKLKTQLSGNDSIKANVPLSKIYYKGFDRFNSKNVFGGTGSIFEKKKAVVLFNEDFSKKGMNGNFELSFWMYVDSRMHNMPLPTLHVFDQEGVETESIIFNNREIHNVYGNWVRVMQTFTIKAKQTYLLEVTGPFVTIDELLIKPKNSNVYVLKENGLELINNFVLE